MFKTHTQMKGIIAIILAITLAFGMPGILGGMTVDAAFNPDNPTDLSNPPPEDYYLTNSSVVISRFLSGVTGPTATGGNIFSVSPAADVSGAMFIEFDVFVPDYAYSGSPVKAFNFFLVTDNNPYDINYRSNYYDFQTQIQHQGWNHIKIKLEHFVSYGNFDSTSITNITFEFWNIWGGSDMWFTNVVATEDPLYVDPIDVPPSLSDALPVNSTVVTELSLPGSRNNNFNISDGETWAFDSSDFDINSAKYIEFDVFFTNRGTNELEHYFTIYSNNDVNQGTTYRYAPFALRNGTWQHVKIPIDLYHSREASPADINNISGLKFYQDANVPAASSFRVVNVVATTDEANIGKRPEVPDSTDYKAMLSPNGCITPGQENGTAIFNLVGGQSTFNGTSVDCSEVTHFEFDIFVEDIVRYDRLDETIMRLTNTGGATISYRIGPFVKQNGWNHVKISINDYDNNDGINITNKAFTSAADATFTNVEFFTYANFKNNIIQIVNLVGTITTDDFAPRPQMPQNPVLVLNERGKMFSNESRGHHTMLYENMGSPADASAATSIEFDVWIDDYEKFREKEVPIFTLGSSTTSVFEDKNGYSFYPYVTGSGWNHIRISIDKNFNTYGPGTFDLSRVTVFQYAGERDIRDNFYYITNLCLTDWIAPADGPPPVFKNDEIKEVNVTSSSITIGWDLAKDENTAAPDMNYICYYSNAPINAGNIGQATQFYTAQGFCTAAVTGLTRSTDYYFAVTAQNRYGKTATLYSGAISTTDVTDKRILFNCTANEIQMGIADTSEPGINAAVKIFSSAVESSGKDNNIILRHKSADDHKNISKYNTLSCDLYIGNIDLYNSSWAPRIYIVLASGSGNGRKAEAFPLDNHTLTQGWNSVYLDISNAYVDLKDISEFWVATSPYGDANTGWYPEKGGNPSPANKYNLQIKVAKIEAFDTDSFFYLMPASLTDPVSLIEDGVWMLLPDESTAGSQMLEKNAIGGKANIEDKDFVKFDFYISDLEALKSNKAFRGINISLLNDPSNKTNDIFNFDFTRLLKKSGWNHIEIPLGMFRKIGMPNPESIKAVLFSISDDSLISADNIKFQFRDVYATSMDDDELLPANPNQPVKPDESEGWFYFADCESLVSKHGTWGPSDVMLDKRNKTDAKASVKNTFFDKELNANSFLFTRVNTVNISDATMLVFDLWTYNAYELAYNTTLEVRLYSGNGYDDYFSWDMDSFDLEDNWNMVVLDLLNADAKKGSPNLTNITAFELRCAEISFSANDYVTVKLDSVCIDSDIAIAQSGGIPKSGDNFPVLWLLLISVSSMGAMLLFKKNGFAIVEKF